MLRDIMIHVKRSAQLIGVYKRAGNYVETQDKQVLPFVALSCGVVEYFRDGMIECYNIAMN